MFFFPAQRTHCPHISLKLFSTYEACTKWITKSMFLERHIAVEHKQNSFHWHCIGVKVEIKPMDTTTSKKESENTAIMFFLWLGSIESLKETPVWATNRVSVVHAKKSSLSCPGKWLTANLWKKDTS